MLLTNAIFRRYACPMNQKLLIITLFSILVPPVGLSFAERTDLHGIYEPGKRRGGHGMAVFGTFKHVYFAHIPMTTGRMHNEQLILKVNLKTMAGDDIQDDFSRGPHSFSPNETHSLDKIAIGKLKKLHGTLFKGNFDIGQGTAPRKVKVEIVQVLVARNLPGTIEMKENQENYFLIGGGVGQPGYLLHVIHRVKEDSDETTYQQILNVKASSERQFFFSPDKVYMVNIQDQTGRLKGIECLHWNDDGGCG